MTLDEIIDRLSEVKITLADKQKTKEWLFEYGCKVAEGYNLDPQKHTGFVSYCGVVKMAELYLSGELACEDPDWRGAMLDFEIHYKGPKSIDSFIKKEYKAGKLPSVQDYYRIIHSESKPIKLEYQKRKKGD